MSYKTTKKRSCIVYVFDGMHNVCILPKEPKQQPLIYFANVCASISSGISSYTATLNLRNENSSGFDDILKCCLRQSKVSVTATNVSIW